MKIKTNYFSGQEARTSEIIRKDGKKYTIREDKLRFFFPDEWMVFFDNLKGPKQKLTFHFLINTGGRISEVSNIKIQDIDFDRLSIIFRFTKSRNKDGTRKIRVISISESFSKYLKKIIKEFNLQSTDNFPILSIPAANIALTKALVKAGIQDYKNFSVHSVRKTAECWLLSLDIDSLKVAKHIGHTIAIAQKYYVSPDTFSWEDKQMMREIIGGLYGK
ncbi:MAG TPA: site-specific integrase [Candidatus Paceibacterota bacterium]|nr:site-specific integrase [Candidatus Paceibacterota bacterium]